MNYPQVVAANIRAEMARRNIRTKTLESALGLGTTAIRERLNGRIDFSLREIPKIAAAVGVPMGVLTCQVGEEGP